MKNSKFNQLKMTANFYLLALTLLISSSQLMGQEKKKQLSAKESEPAQFGWMKGFPPAPDRILKASDVRFSSFRQFVGVS